MSSALSPVRTPGADAAELPGRLATLLADGDAPDLERALQLLVETLDLTDAWLGEAESAQLGIRLVQARTAITRLPMCAGGRHVGTLTVQGARAHQLPVLTAAAAVLALALRPATGATAEELVAAADADADAAADRLHDGAMQALVVARYAADAATRGGSQLLARDAVQAALVEFRRALWHQRPRGRTEGLAQALDVLADRLQEAGGAPLTCALHQATAAALPAAAVSTAYRLVQALALDADRPLHVTLTRDGDGDTAVLETRGGRPLTEVTGWSRRAAAHGGSLTCASGAARLVLPLIPSTKAFL